MTSRSWRSGTQDPAGRDSRSERSPTRLGVDIIDVLLDIILVEGLTLFLVLPSLTPSLGRSEEGWRARVSVWKDPRVMLGGSDAGAHLDLMCHANYPTVVLGEVVRDRGLLSLEEAIEMMTDRPARHYGLRDRGRVATGYWADLVVFDPDLIGSNADRDGERPTGGRRTTVCNSERDRAGLCERAASRG